MVLTGNGSKCYYSKCLVFLFEFCILLTTSNVINGEPQIRCKYPEDCARQLNAPLSEFGCHFFVYNGTLTGTVAPKNKSYCSSCDFPLVKWPDYVGEIRGCFNQTPTTYVDDDDDEYHGAPCKTNNDCMAWFWPVCIKSECSDCRFEVFDSSAEHHVECEPVLRPFYTKVYVGIALIILSILGCVGCCCYCCEFCPVAAWREERRMVVAVAARENRVADYNNRIVSFHRLAVVPILIPASTPAVASPQNGDDDPPPKFEPSS